MFSSFRLDRLLLSICGLVCIIASLLKASILCYGCPLFCVLGSCQLTATISLAEGIIGVFILNSTSAKSGYVLSVFTFAVFFVCSIIFPLVGVVDCGCFGSIQAPLGLFIIINGSILSLLVLIRPDKSTITYVEPTIPKLTVCWLVFVAIWTSLVVINPFLSQSAPGITETRDAVFLSPDEWLGIPVTELGLTCGNLSYRKIQDGQIVLVRGNCPECRSLFETLLQTKTNTQDICFVLLPPFDEAISRLSNATTVHVSVCDQEKVWICKTPVLIKISNGEIVHVDY